VNISVTQFAIDRHFGNPEFSGTKVNSHTPESFVEEFLTCGSIQKPGYAPFCRHIFVPNFTDALMGVHEITPENKNLLKSGYKARREGELPILTRWFDGKDVSPTACRWLDVIVYSKGQMEREGKPIDTDWGIVTILSAVTHEEAPMPPITMMRNALGKAEGGSGVPIDRAYYARAVEYWSRWATIK
jgi:hypothetical protein